MAVLDIVNNQYKVPQTHYTPALESGSVTHHPFTDSIAYIGDLVQWAAPCRLASTPSVAHYSGVQYPK